MHFYTTLKKVELIAFVDTGATENFISQAFVEEHRIGTKPLWRPKLLHNADGTPNKGGIVDRFADLEVATGDSIHTLRFYIADMGKDQMVLGYPWFIASNPQPNWA